MNDHAEGMGDDSFSPEDQAAWDSMQGGDDAAPEPAGAVDGPVAAPVAPEAPVAPAAAPGEVVDPETEEGAPEENKGKFVRHGAFHQERERRKAVERELGELRERHARADERLRLFTEATQGRAAAAPAAPATPAPVAPPDPNEDIFGAYKHLQAELEALRTGQTQMTEAQKQAETERQAETQRTETLNTYRGDIQRVMATTPEFGDAYEHLFQGRVQELKLFGMSDADAVKSVREDELAIVQAAVAANQSPAERIMQMAKIRGFAPKVADPVPAAPAETAAEKSARIAKGQAASLSLSAAGGAPAGEITLEMLASMSEADFAKMEKANPSRVRALMGG